MKKNQLLLLIALSISTSIFAQIKKSKDIAAIKKMCGCFEVTFNFSETFNYSDDSLYIPSKNKTDRALELALLIKDENNELSIQHLLQMGDNDNAYIVKHWRQDWQFQNKDFYMFNGDNNWLYVNKPYKEVRNQWSQKVYQVDDSPRYEGSSSWVHVDGKSYWENTTDAPLPRRERTKRSDYNVTERGSRVEIMDYGWLHDQDNRKIIRTGVVAGVFYNIIKIDSYIINISSKRIKSSTANFNGLLDIKHEMLKSFYFKKNFLSWNTVLSISFKNDKSKIISKKIYLTLLSKKNKLKLENLFNKILIK